MLCSSRAAARERCATPKEHEINDNFNAPLVSCHKSTQKKARKLRRNILIKIDARVNSYSPIFTGVFVLFAPI